MAQHQSFSAFPKIDTPTYTLRLPITKTEITYRPYLTKEEKLLLMALESKEAKTVIAAIRQIAINCTLSPAGLDIDNLPMVDLEYYFLHLRSKSKGEVLDAKFSCKAIVVVTKENEDDPDSGVCGNILTLGVRIDELKVKIPDTYKDVIPITDEIGVKMRLPRYKDSARVMASASGPGPGPADGAGGEASPARQAYNLILTAIESVYDKDQIYPVTAENFSELETFIESLTSEQFAKIEEFFESIPVIDYTFNAKCSKCGYDHTIAYRDIASFF